MNLLDKARRVGGPVDPNREAHVERLAAIYDEIAAEVGHEPDDADIDAYVAALWREAQFVEAP